MTAGPFDPIASSSDMPQVGAALIPSTIATGRSAGQRMFAIGGTSGVPADVLAIRSRHETAAFAHPDRMAAVHDALLARRGGL